MSTGADCHFHEVEPGKWDYRLQRWPYGEWPEYDTFGPFPSFEKAREHLSNNHANPGGWSVRTHPQHVHEWHRWGPNDPYDCEACGSSVDVLPTPATRA